MEMVLNILVVVYRGFNNKVELIYLALMELKMEQEIRWRQEKTLGL